MPGRVNQSAAKPVKIDLKDKRILSMLAEDGRIPLSEISKKTKLSRETVDYRIKRLIKKGIVLGVIPQINLGYFGFNTYHVFMVTSIGETRKQELIDTLVKHPNTRSLMEYHDAWDLEWVLIARSLREFDSILIDITNEFRDVILRKDKLTIIKGFKSIQLPVTLYQDYTHKKKERRPKEKINFDNNDLAILKALSINARQSTYDLSRIVSLSPDAISYRMKKMLTGGVIFGYSILINLTVLRFYLHTFCINVKTLGIQDEMKFREFISANPSILRAVKVLGDWDILIYVTSENLDSFHTTFKETQENLSTVLSDWQTWAAYKEHVYKNLPEAVVATAETFLNSR